MDCLNTVIGITRNECPCIIDSFTPLELAKMRVSDSGLYLDELEGLPSIKNITAAADCKDFVNISQTVIENAKTTVISDILMELSEKYQSTKKTFIGSIGQGAFFTTLESQGLNYLMLTAQDQQTDALFTLNGVKVAVNKSGLINFVLIKEVNGIKSEIYRKENIEVNGNSFNLLNPDKSIELSFVENSSAINYYFVWWAVNDPEIKPKDNKLSCGCGGGDPFAEYFRAGSGTSESTSDLKINDVVYTRGFVIDVTAKCDTGNLICKSYTNDNAIALTIAHMVLFAAGSKLIDKIILSDQINRFTLLSSDYLIEIKKQYLENYRSRLVYLKHHIDINSSDCFICRSNKIYKRSILL